MVTIKDVAEAAGVSVGTVSNVINGKTRNEKLIRDVEKMIDELGFQVNGRARSLKKKDSHMIGLLVNRLQEPGMRLMAETIEQSLRSMGYSIVLKTTDDNRILEKKSLEQVMNIGVDGIIIIAGNTKRNWKKLLDSTQKPIVLIGDSSDIPDNASVITVNYEKALDDFFAWCRDKNYHKVDLIWHKEFLDEEKILKIRHQYSAFDIQYKIVGSSSKETGFKAAYEMYYQNRTADVIFIGNKELAVGVFQAARILKCTDFTSFVCVKNSNWVEDDDIFDAIVDVSYYELAEKAFQKMKEGLKHGKNLKSIDTIYAGFELIPEDSRKGIGRSSEKSARELNLAILNSDTAKVLEKMAVEYELQTGVKIHCHCFEYHDLWKTICNPSYMDELSIDALMYDIVWKESLISQKRLLDITYLEAENPDNFQGYIDGVADLFGRMGGKLYGIPFLPGTQLLFYQRDLFEDEMVQIQFGRMFGYRLAVPKTLGEFLNVAKFFTREYNDRSAVKYGTAIINQGNLYNSIELLNRLWTYDLEIVKDGRLNLDSPEVKIAIEEYKQIYQYTDKKLNIQSWEDKAAEFKRGNIAMAEMYDSFAFEINDHNNSKVAGNIGCAPIIGNCPVVGGWGLGIYNNSKNKKAIQDFILWVSSPKRDNIISVLSGVSNRKQFYLNKDLDNLYPWKNKVLESYNSSRNRKHISDVSNYELDMKFYDEILGKTLGDILLGKITIEDGLEKIKEETKRIL